MAQLFIQQAGETQLLTDPVNSHTYLIGRDENCTICIPEDSISSRHAQLAQVKAGWELKDLGSANGTAVNGKPAKQAVLKNGDQIQMGTQVILIFADESAPAAAAPAQQEQHVKKQKQNLKVQGASEDDIRLVKEMSQRSQKIRNEIAKVIIGQVEVIDQVMMVIIAGGHGLLVGMPGMAKTTLCATIAKVLEIGRAHV